MHHSYMKQEHFVTELYFLESLSQNSQENMTLVLMYKVTSSHFIFFFSDFQNYIERNKRAREPHRTGE